METVKQKSGPEPKQYELQNLKPVLETKKEK